nr:MAG: single-stranded DNA binding protein [Bacteriophage sp.]
MDRSRQRWEDLRSPWTEEDRDRGISRTQTSFRALPSGRTEFVEKYTHKGTKVIVEGEIRTGSYTNREGRKVYTTEIYVSDIEFAESKAAAEQNQNRNDDQYGMTGDDGFMNIPDGEELPPFN